MIWTLCPLPTCSAGVVIYRVITVHWYRRVLSIKSVMAYLWNFIKCPVRIWVRKSPGKSSGTVDDALLDSVQSSRCTAQLGVRLVSTSKAAGSPAHGRSTWERVEEGCTDVGREGQKCWELLVGTTLKSFIATGFVTL